MKFIYLFVIIALFFASSQAMDCSTQYWDCSLTMRQVNGDIMVCQNQLKRCVALAALREKELGSTD